MATFNFALSNGSSYVVKTVLETESGFFIDPFNNDDAVIDAWTKYRTEQEDEAFRNQPPELFKFYEIKYCDETGRSYTQLVGTESEDKARSLFKEWEEVEVVRSYEKYCNFAALMMDEAMAQCTCLFE